MAENPPWLVAMLTAAIGALFSLLAWLWRTTLDRAYKRIDVLEGRERDVLAAVTKALEGIQSTLVSLVEHAREDRRARRDLGGD